MKNKFISRLLSLVTIMVLLCSCRNELLTEQETHDTSSQFKPTSKTIRLEQSKHKFVLKTELQKAQDNLKETKTNSLGKSADYANGVSIDTDHVTYIEYGSNFYTYTFNLIRENAPESAPIENLVLAPRADGTYREILVTYNLTTQEKQSILHGENVSTKGKSDIMELSDNTFSPLTSKGQSCSWVEADSYTWCSESVHHNGEGSGSCTADTKSQLIKVMLLKCDSFDDGSGNSGGGGSSLGGTDTGGGTEIPTKPTISTFFFYTKKLPVELKNILFDTANTEYYDLFKALYELDVDTQNFITLCLKANLPSTITATQFKKFFLDGYTIDFQHKLSQLSVSEIQDYAAINLEIENSPYDEDYVKETNEAFVAFTASADIDNMTEAQMQTVLTQCCPSIIVMPQAFINEKVKLIATNYLHLRKLYPSWSKGKCFWNASKETIHLFLDIAGTVPVIGEVCDITNGFIYTIEGDGLNATLSYAGAIPIAGWGATGAKLAIKTVAGGVSLAMIKNADGFYIVSRNQALFRKVLGMVSGDARIAHHIIPFALQTNPAVQKAMLSKNAFMINEALNGIPLNSAVHSGSHKHYNKLIENYLNNWHIANPNATPEQAYNFVMFVVEKAKTAIKNNPNIKINDLNF